MFQNVFSILGIVIKCNRITLYILLISGYYGARFARIRYVLSVVELSLRLPTTIYAEPVWY